MKLKLSFELTESIFIIKWWGCECGKCGEGCLGLRETLYPATVCTSIHFCHFSLWGSLCFCLNYPEFLRLQTSKPQSLSHTLTLRLDEEYFCIWLGPPCSTMPLILSPFHFGHVEVKFHPFRENLRETWIRSILIYALVYAWMHLETFHFPTEMWAENSRKTAFPLFGLPWQEPFWGHTVAMVCVHVCVQCLFGWGQ